MTCDLLFCPDPPRHDADSRWRPGLCEAVGTTTPIGDLGLVDLVTHVVSRREAWSRADRAFDVDDAAAIAADQMMVVIAHAIFESSR